MSAHDFEVDGIFYNISGDEAVVTFKGNEYSEYDYEYSGDIVIPSTVKYNGKIYAVTTIGDAAFAYCDLKSIVIPNSITSIGDYVFLDGFSERLISITIPNSVTSIGDGVFSDCSEFRSVIIPNGVTSIGEFMFAGCRNLRNFTIPNSVTSIGNNAFVDCKSLKSVTIPNSVTSIGDYAFSTRSALTSINVLNKPPVAIDSDVFTYYDATLYVPQGSIEAYKAADYWKNFENIVEFDATAIEDVTDDAPAFGITAGGVLFTAAVEGKEVAVYAASGALIEKIDSYAGEEIALGKGVYIIRVGGKSVKVKL